MKTMIIRIIVQPKIVKKVCESYTDQMHICALKGASFVIKFCILMCTMIFYIVVHPNDLKKVFKSCPVKMHICSVIGAHCVDLTPPCCYKKCCILMYIAYHSSPQRCENCEK